MRTEVSTWLTSFSFSENGSVPFSYFRNEATFIVTGY